MKLRHHIAVAVSALALITGGLVISPPLSPPAEATWGSSVKVQQGSGYIKVRSMNGNYYSIGPGGYIENVASIWIPRNTCMAIGGYIYCAGVWGQQKTIWQQKTYSVSSNVA